MARGIVSFRQPVSTLLGPQDRELLGQLIIERIQERAESGRDIDGRRFARYSRNYIEQLREIGADTGLDLVLTGEMINSIQVLSHGEGFVEIGLEAGTFAARKAMYNQGGNPAIPNRPFMGIRDSEADSLGQEVIDGSPTAQAQRFLNENNIIGRILEGITLGV